jgi:hypothetical protein
MCYELTQKCLKAVTNFFTIDCERVIALLHHIQYQRLNDFMLTYYWKLSSYKKKTGFLSIIKSKNSYYIWLYI